MDKKSFYKELDKLFSLGHINKVDTYLHRTLDEAEKINDFNMIIVVLNEFIGYYRVTNQYDKGTEVITLLENLLSDNNVKYVDEETIGTSFVNIATILRAMGRASDAEKYYIKAEAIYKRILDANDYKMAGLFNNMSLCYQELEQYDSALEYLYFALEIIRTYSDKTIQLAVTYTNLGQVYLRLDNTDDALSKLKTAKKLFEETDLEDEHYGALLNALGYLYFKLNDYNSSIHYYEEALIHVKNAYGVTKDYKDIRKSLKLVYKLNGEPEYSSMLEICKAYYEKYGRPMISLKFHAYESRIAVGLCGEGSECFGVEDEISSDHDFGPGFAMWVDDEVYEEIGEELSVAYEELPKVFAGYIRTETAYGRNRIGVCTIDDYYKRVLCTDTINWDNDSVFNLDESLLANAVNGEVFRDDEGQFTRKRNFIKSYYPTRIWLSKLSRELMYAAQTGQYNYGRMMARKEHVTAEIILSEYMKSIMHIVYLINREYMPYYKWQHKLMAKLNYNPEIGDILEAVVDMPYQNEAWDNYDYDGTVNPRDMISGIIEIVAGLITNTLKEMGLSDSNDTYLEVQGKEVLKRMDDNKNTLIDEIIKYEWTEFDQVKNEGKRASCQDDFYTFSIMRKSQYLTWNEDMLEEYLWHIDDSLKKGRNLITEKYGRMMASTAKDKYEEIKMSFAPLSEEKTAIIEAIVAIQVKWMEEFAARYPKMAINARSIHSNEDTKYNTSYETYLRGELSTYSDELLEMYGRFIANLLHEDNNLAYLTMENTAKLYGYKNIEDAESKI